MSYVGLHIRLTSSLDSVVQKATRLNLPFFQCFLTGQRGKNIEFCDEEKQLLKSAHQHFQAAYLHGSYWMNLCTNRSSKIELIHKEFLLAQELGFTHIVLHPGSAKLYGNKQEGIDQIARTLNSLHKQYKELTIVLENTAHGRLNIGSDLQDFRLLLEKLDAPDSIEFCLDTAHAYSYGYDVASVEGHTAFLSLVDETIGLQRVGLIHLNDTQEELGKRIDCHHALGTGNIGDDALCRFVTSSGLQNVPIILELPMMHEEDEIKMLEKVQRWKNKCVREKLDENCY